MLKILWYKIIFMPFFLLYIFYSLIFIIHVSFVFLQEYQKNFFTLSTLFIIYFIYKLNVLFFFFFFFQKCLWHSKMYNYLCLLIYFIYKINVIFFFFFLFKKCLFNNTILTIFTPKNRIINTYLFYLKYFENFLFYYQN